MFKALDLFCGAGGATRGLQRAGFTVHGIDIKRQPHYCGEQFTCGDALKYGTYEWFRQFDFVWASPPCQRYSTGAAKWKTSMNHPDLITRTRGVLQAMRVPFVIENIVPAKPHLQQPLMLCGQQFGLGVFRHRLFEASFGFEVPVHAPHIGKIGDGRFITVTGHSGGSSNRDGWKNGTLADGKRAMGIDWMTWAEMAEAIPPAYSEYIARKFLEYQT